MLRFLFTRVSLIIPTFIGITLLVFVLVRLIPGDPIETMAGEHGIDAALHERLRHEYGFDRPVIVQYALYLSRLMHGDLGRSIVTHKPVIEEFTDLFPATVELSVIALLFALCIGLPAGIIAAVRRNSIFDHGVMGLALTGYSMPIFWWGLLLILLFSVQLGWTPVSGRIAVLYFIEPKTGFLLIDTLLAGDTAAFWSALIASDSAGYRARHHTAGGDRAHDALGDARSARRGLHPHRPRQGPVERRASSPCTPCATHLSRS